MDYIINRDISMTIYAAVLFSAVFLLHRLISAVRKRRIPYRFYAAGMLITAAWEFLYSAGTWWKHNNGLLGAYYMISVPVIGVVCAAVLSCVFGRRKDSGK